MQVKEVEHIILENKDKIFDLGVRELSLFGSFLKGTATEKSDIDFLVEFEKNAKSFKNLMHLSFLLEKLFLKKIDLVTPQSLSKYFGNHILDEAKPLLHR